MIWDEGEARDGSAREGGGSTSSRWQEFRWDRPISLPARIEQRRLHPLERISPSPLPKPRRKKERTTRDNGKGSLSGRPCLNAVRTLSIARSSSSSPPLSLELTTSPPSGSFSSALISSSFAFPFPFSPAANPVPVVVVVPKPGGETTGGEGGLSISCSACNLAANAGSRAGLVSSLRFESHAARWSSQ